MRILVLSYSQSGDVDRVTASFCAPLHGNGIELVHRRIQPEQDYPYPWRSLPRLIDVMPECVGAIAPPIRSLQLEEGESFDLVLLSYQVWHFSPSLPVQGFLCSPWAALLRETPVITLVTSRNMWHSASLSMRDALARAGALHIDNVVVTHAGPPWTTFVTVPRALLFGRKDPLWGIFPSAEIGDAECERLRRLGQRVREQLDGQPAAPRAPLLADTDAVVLERRFILPEYIACRGARLWGRALRAVGRRSRWLRDAGVYAYLVYLVSMILIGLPVAIVLLLVSYPFVKHRIDAYAHSLTLPSGGRVR